MLEKVCEIGVQALVPMICHRTERGHVRMDRLQSIAMSAMLQSRQAWFTEVKEPVTFDKLIAVAGQEDRFIAHCLPNGTVPLRTLHPGGATSLLLIGREGDFTEMEIGLALSSGFRAVALGANRLRTETAAVVAAALTCI
jgi:16S rRNA (uracil1498-N3)-methyltransferase